MNRLFPALRSQTRFKQYRTGTIFYSIVIIYFIFVVKILMQVDIFSYFNLTAPIAVPAGFHAVLNQTGIKVYQKNYFNGAPDFVTVVDLQAATLRNLTGTVTGEAIDRKPLSRFWQDAVSQNVDNFKAQVVLNGTFFGNNRNEVSEIAFGLKAKGTLINYGYGLDEYPGLNKTFAFHSFAANAQIQPYRHTTFDAFPDVIGALTAQADKSASRRLGRTFVGAINPNKDLVSDTVLFFSSAASTQAHAETVLKQFGATAIAMLDGGGSTGLIVDGVAQIDSDRSLPHAIAIYADKPEAPIFSLEGKCLAVNGTNLLDRADLQLTRCNGSDTQRWSLRGSALQTANGQCLDASDRGHLDAAVWLLSCNGSLAQRWTFENGLFKGSGDRCLDTAERNSEDSLEDSRSVQLHSCSDAAIQRWQRID